MNLKALLIHGFFTFLCVVKLSIQNCVSETNTKGIAVTWPASPEGVNLTSFPICLDTNNEIITRNCSGSQWHPTVERLSPCMRIVNDIVIDACPPGYIPIPHNNSIYCFNIIPAQHWDYPCYQSGGASVIHDLNYEEITGLINLLNSTYDSPYYWLPAQRPKRFNPLIWTTPGPNWGNVVTGGDEILPLRASLYRNCLALDVRNKALLTENCNNIYPSLCLYIKDINYPANCPDGYRAIRYMNDFNTCFGVESSDSPDGSTFEEFLENKCDKPMGDNHDLILTSFVFQKMATYLDLGVDDWCWFAMVSENVSREAMFKQSDNELKPIRRLEGAINKHGNLGLLNRTKKLPCMACEKNSVLSETELKLIYRESERKVQLTVYTPSGLWKYDQDDDGFRCFSNAKGFTTLATALPYHIGEELKLVNDNEEKLQYIINPISDRVGEYWCEGHTKEFHLVASNVVMVSLDSNNEHVFAMCVELNLNNTGYYFSDMSESKQIIQNMYNAENVILMDILEATKETTTVVLHVQVVLSIESDELTKKIVETLANMEKTAQAELSEHNITLVNISSSIYCLPTVSGEGSYQLEWPLTAIGEIAAPAQFCLQENGLPVKRKCTGTYIGGAFWGPIEGKCNKNYQPSNTTTFLYEVAMKKSPENYTTSFLTTGLSFVLSDIEIFIPADIYYLSMSLKHISDVAHENSSELELGDLKNIAWTMDRLMILNNNYLNLAQTLNSTNVILDSVTNLIEILATLNNSINSKQQTDFHQIAVQPQFITQYSYPVHNNISGIALLRTSESMFFTNMTILPLHINSSIDDVLALENLEIASWIPQDVLNSLEPICNATANATADYDSNDLYIVINIFYNDAIFQEVDKHDHVVNSRIIEIEIPGFSNRLQHHIPLLFNIQSNVTNKSFCGYWEFHSNENVTTPGYWNKEGCYFEKIVNNTVICKCLHLTHFAQLITSNPNNKPPKHYSKHTKALNIITLAGSFLSLTGILGIWITATVFSVWRRKAGTKVLLQLSLAIAMPLIIIIIFSFSSSLFIRKDGVMAVADCRKILCIVLGALLHYFILVGFVWMLITAVLQFVRYVRVIGVPRPTRFMMKLSFTGWGLPALPVALVLLINKDSYLPTPSSDSFRSICYPTGTSFILSVLFPIIVIVIINVSLFVAVLVSISKGPGGKMRALDIDLVKAQMRLSIFLFFLLGLTWVFGIFSFSDSFVWSYLFCLTSTMQGFVLFVYFVICDPSTRNLWVSLVKPQFRSFSSRESITSISR